VNVPDPGSADPGSADPAELVRRAHDGDARALGRVISLIEDRAPTFRSVLKGLAQLAGKARVVGLTGPPGVGKSTVTGALVAAYRARGLRVAVLAVDPSSPFTGGALLGDRVRMQDHATDGEVFIRSMASRGHGGGLAVAAPQVLRALDAARFDVILIETVGVGQVEIEVASLADSVVVLVAPGSGDAIQAAKAGILEIGDVFVVNKADRPDAQPAVRDLRGMVALAQRAAGAWKPPIVSTVAVSGEGIEELADRLDAHWDWLKGSGELDDRRLARARAEVTAIAFGSLRERILGGSELDRLASRVADGQTDAYSAADELVAAITG
jgi:LAO/AO transport system kinase